ncbi:hypothetical protein V8E53_000013 [Lactarius tabidus]
MPGVDLSNSLGATLIALLVCTVLFGLTLGQTWIYFWHYWDKDSKALKSFIAFITLMDSFHTILIAYSIYWYLILNFGNFEASAANKWFTNFQSNIGGIYSSAVRLYYARKIYLLTQNIIPPTIIVTMCIAGNALGFYVTARMSTAAQVSNRFHSMTLLAGIGMGEGAVEDALIAGMMCWALYRKKTGIARTDSMLMTLMAYTLNSGMLTCVLGVATTISFIVSPESMLTMAIFIPMGKCYVNTLLAVLNSRDYIRGRSSPDNSDNSFDLSSIRVVPPGEAFGSKSKQTDMSVIARRSTAPDHAQNISNPNSVSHAFEVPKLDTSITSQSQSRTSVPSA